ncbi:MAG: class I tRNA ligase family protein, partial [Halioglobus sp.]|nr:class I tRNA ligase family protein [Halioglobus sp.]
APYGTDALRFTYFSLASTGRDIKFDIGRIEGFRNFCNKIWNAARYVLMNCENEDCGAQEGAALQLSTADHWINGRFDAAAAEVARAVQAYRFDLASQALYEFIWNEYCDWYLELSKPVLWDDQAPIEAKRGTRRTLVGVLEKSLRLLHPFMPFITEEIWQSVAPLAGKTGATIMLQPYPAAQSAPGERDAEAAIEWLQAVILGIRTIRSEMNIPPGREISVLLKGGDATDKKRLAQNSQYLKKLTKLSDVSWLADGEEAPPAATALAGELEILVPMAGLIDKDDEIARLNKEIGKLQQAVSKIESKLGNANFTDKAPAEVVAKERQKLEAEQQALTTLHEQLQRIEKI